MSQRRLLLSAMIIIGVVLVGFVLSVPHARDLGKPPSSDDESRITPVVTIRDSYKRGVHTITGSVTAPNACTTISAEASLVGASSTESILVALSLPKDSGVCLQIPTPLTFSVTVEASARLPIRATVNGTVASTTMP